ncbi:MAG: type II toxin-antitoxin system Phd/YefM family antitoxin [Christensenellaceae bacterium]|nr:type II toxin-antitoxin system Phd/YefM family antitoxin [Christensenellaceae bacterium]
MVVTVYEFMKHFNEYIEMLKYEDIYLTENGKTIAKVSNPKDSAVDALTGILKSTAPDDLDKKDIREERLKSFL